MFIAALGMFVTLAVAAGAIDVASWYQKHHQAQVAADAASLAAANCLANSGPGQTCTSPTDTTDAIQVAEQIAADNGLTIAASQVQIDTTSGQVTVSPGTTAPSILAEAAGIQNATIAADAAAGYVPGRTSSTVETGSTVEATDYVKTTPETTTTTTPETTTTTTPETTTTTIPETTTTTIPVTTTTTTTTQIAGGNYLALFAMDSNNCATKTNASLYLQGGGDTVKGGIFSNGSVYVDGGSFNQIYYGTGSGCTFGAESGGNVFNPSADNPSQASVDAASWPVPYNTSQDPLPGCTSTHTGSGTWSIPGQPTGEQQVFCAVGTGQAGDPSTWNGTILLTGAENNPYPGYPDDTFIGGSLSVGQGGMDLEAADWPNQKLLMYMTDTGKPVDLTYGAGALHGDVETPNGSIYYDSGGNAFDGLLEGLSVDVAGGGGDTYYGDGPTTYGYTSTTQTTTTYTTQTSTTYTTNTSTNYVTNTTTTYTTDTLTNYSTTTTPTTQTVDTTTTVTTTTPGTDGLVK